MAVLKPEFASIWIIKHDMALKIEFHWKDQWNWEILLMCNIMGMILKKPKNAKFCDSFMNFFLILQLNNWNIREILLIKNLPIEIA